MDPIEKEAGLLGNLNKTVFKANAPLAAIMSIPTVANLNSRKVSGGEAIKQVVQNAIPGSSEMKSSVMGLKDEFAKSRLDTDMLKPKYASFDEFLDECLEKEAEDDTNTNVTNALADISAAGATGAAVYFGGNKLINYLDDKGKLSNLEVDLDKTITDIGKNTGKAITRNKFLPNVMRTIYTNTGKALGTAPPDGLQSDFTTTLNKGSLGRGIKNLALYLALIGGTTAASDYITDKAKEEYNDLITHIHTKAFEVTDEIEKTAYNADGLEDVGRTLKRGLYDRIDQPIKGTGTFLLSLGGLSYLLGRNLYGGFEKVDKSTNNQTRIILDVPKKPKEVTAFDSFLDECLEKEAGLRQWERILEADLRSSSPRFIGSPWNRRELSNSLKNIQYYRKNPRELVDSSGSLPIEEALWDQYRVSEIPDDFKRAVRDSSLNPMDRLEGVTRTKAPEAVSRYKMDASTLLSHRHDIKSSNPSPVPESVLSIENSYIGNSRSKNLDIQTTKNKDFSYNVNDPQIDKSLLGKKILGLGLAGTIGILVGNEVKRSRSQKYQEKKSFDQFLDECLEKEAVNKFDAAKKSIDEWVARYSGPGSKGLKKYQDFLIAGGKKEYEYKGEKGLGHELLETIPFKAVEGIAYSTPLVASALLLNRNPKRGFAPIQEDPTAPPLAPGMQRIIIQEADGTQKKVAFDEFLDECLEKEAFIGFGIGVKSLDKDEKYNVTTGFPQIIGVSRNFGTGTVRPSVGVGFPFPITIGAGYFPDKRKFNLTEEGSKIVSKSKALQKELRRLEKLNRKPTKEELYQLQANIDMKRRALKDAEVDS